MPPEKLQPLPEDIETLLPEEAWLLLWVRPGKSRSKEEVLQGAAMRVRSWYRVLEIAHENGIAPLLATILRSVVHDEAALPGWFLQELEHRRYACLARSAQVAFHLGPLLVELQEAGLTPMVLKGALLSETVYPEPGARFFSDVDLLVAPEEVPMAHQVLERRGYAATRPVDLSRPPAPGRYLNSIFYRSREGECHPIHLHWHLLNTSSAATETIFQVGMADLWAEARKIELWGAPVRAPNKHHLVAYQAEHAYREGFRKLSLLTDVAWSFPANGGPLDWQEILQVALDWGLAAHCYSSFFLCKGMGLVEVPKEVLRRLRPRGRHKLAGLILRRTIERPGVQPWGKLLYLVNQPGLLGRIRFLFRALCPSLQESEVIYRQAARSLTALGYLRRFSRRLAVGVRTGWAATWRLARPSAHSPSAGPR